jgi:endoglucanase
MSPGGSIAGAVSIPTRHLHQVIEMAHKDDVQASINLLSSCLLELHNFNYSF